MIARNVIRSKAKQIISDCGTRDPFAIAEAMGVTIKYIPFNRQKGAYAVIKGKPFIFLKEDLNNSDMRTVLAHELGHEIFHKDCDTGIHMYPSCDEYFKIRTEYEANLFAAELLISDDDILSNINKDIYQIAESARVIPPLVVLKCNDMSARGFPVKQQDRGKMF